MDENAKRLASESSLRRLIGPKKWAENSMEEKIEILKEEISYLRNTNEVSRYNRRSL